MRTRRRLTGSLVVLLPVLTLVGGPSPTDATHPWPEDPRPGGHAATPAALEDANGTPGAVVRVDRGRRHWSGTAGVADLHRPGGRTPRDHFRIASVTKTFTAATLLTLEADGRLSLDDSVETWLPGLLDRNGYDGRSITVGQLLDHTSGVFDVLDDRDFVSRYVGRAFFAHRFDSWTPRELVEVAISHQPLFDPGEGWSARAYSHLFVDGPDAPTYDVTEFNPSLAAAAGEIISTTRDLNVFIRELLSGTTATSSAP